MEAVSRSVWHEEIFCRVPFFALLPDAISYKVKINPQND
jgi:hypothetical protein